MVIGSTAKGQFHQIKVVQNDDNRQHCNSDTSVSSNAIHCVSLDQLSNYLPSSGNLSITFESEQGFVLKSLILFVNLKQLNIRATSSKSVVLKCLDTGLGVGIKFDKILDVQIANLAFENCGGKHQTYGKRANVSFSSALFFNECGNVSFRGVSVSHSSGFGVVMYDVIGNTVIQESIFHNNTAVNFKKARAVGGGGLYIGFTPYDHTVKKTVNILILTVHLLETMLKFIQEVLTTQCLGLDKAAAYLSDCLEHYQLTS